jgi:predicted MPP superfamily phosphohydrolase
MNVALSVALVALALIGHAAIWVGLVNRWHATGFRRAIIKTVTLVFYAGLLAIPPLIAWRLRDARWASPRPWIASADPASIYITLSALYALVHIPRWAAERWRSRSLPAGVRLEGVRATDITDSLGMVPAGGPRAALLGRLPGNQLWQLHVSEFSVRLPRMAASLDGLSVCHWSDFHLSGRIDLDYFHEVVRLTNLANPDLIALTGDICDAASCIDWLSEILAPVQARLGKFFILGNHDLRTKDLSRLRSVLTEAGFVDLGGRCVTIHDGQIELAGNERPWIADESPASNGSAQPNRGPLKILLSHSPDQLAWARERGFDLMLAGHTHGGQICFPVIGPVLCPSWHGVKYAAGFFDDPPTMMHVSRGTASHFPVRWNCPPEITKLVLRHGE